MFEHTPEPKRMVTLEGGHNSGFLGNETAYRWAWTNFVAWHIGSPED